MINKYILYNIEIQKKKLKKKKLLGVFSRLSCQKGFSNHHLDGLVGKSLPNKAIA